MVLVLLDYYPELDVAGGTAPLRVGSIEFKVNSPTDRRNEIDSSEWGKVKSHPSIVSRLDKGVLRLVGGKQPIAPKSVSVQPPLFPSAESVILPQLEPEKEPEKESRKKQKAVANATETPNP